MTARTARRGRTTAAVLLALFVLAATPSISAERPLDAIRTDMQAIQGLFKNTSMKIKHVAMGSGSGPGDGGLVERGSDAALSRPVANCCSRNVEKIQARLDSIAGSIRELHERSKAKEDQAALEAISHMAETYREMGKAFRTFSNIDSATHARAALTRFGAMYNHFERATEKYADCCDRTGKKGKKNKKERKDEPAGDGDGERSN